MEGERAEKARRGCESRVQVRTGLYFQRLQRRFAKERRLQGDSEAEYGACVRFFCSVDVY